MLSIQTRLLVTTSLVLVVFVSSIGVILDQAFRTNAQRSAFERLKGHINTILAAAPVDDDGNLSPPGAISDSKFYVRGSGLYARILDAQNNTLWVSLSVDREGIPFNEQTQPQKYNFQIKHDDLGSYFTVAFTTVFEFSDAAKGLEKKYTFQATEALAKDEGYLSETGDFRYQLIKWLGALAVVLLGVMIGALRWGALAPLRNVARELERVKAGASRSIPGEFPLELRGLTESINRLIASERAQQERYRNSLGDLAHSLKTPLSVLVAGAGDPTLQLHNRPEVLQQVERMRQIIDYQLQRAATSGRSTMVAPVPVAQSINRILDTLDRAYSDKKVSSELQADAALQFLGDEGDFLELLGNSLDNAYKWCRRQVRVTAHRASQEHRLELLIEDDGPGVPPDQIESVLRRGYRADESTSGQGIGLAVVKEIVSAYQGEIKIERSELGGACLRILL